MLGPLESGVIPFEFARGKPKVRHDIPEPIDARLPI